MKKSIQDLANEFLVYRKSIKNPDDHSRELKKLIYARIVSLENELKQSEMFWMGIQDQDGIWEENGNLFFGCVRNGKKLQLN